MRVIPECLERGPLVLIVVPGASQNAIHEYTVEEARRFAREILAAVEWLEAK